MAVGREMKLLIFAHTPPPHHGQSFMVQMVLEGLGGDVRTGGSGKGGIRCYHVNSRFSDSIGQIGYASAGKGLRLLRYLAEAVWCRVWHGADVFFCVPASGVRSAVYRDWGIMMVAKLLFRERVYHWQASGLSEWLEKEARPWEKKLTRLLLKRPSLSIVLGESVRGDAVYFESRRTAMIFNAVPDPAPDCRERILPARMERAETRRAFWKGAMPGAAPVFQLLYLSLCMREKGLFDAVEAVARVNAKLGADGRGIRVRFVVAGSFYTEAERAEFEVRVAQRDLNGGGTLGDGGPVVQYRGFVRGVEKSALFEASDAFIFPSYYPMEGHPVSLVEAMAYGMPVIATRWRALPELFPEGHPFLVEPRRPDVIADKILELMTSPWREHGRSRYEEDFTRERFLERLSKALEGLGPVEGERR